MLNESIAGDKNVLLETPSKPEKTLETVMGTDRYGGTIPPFWLVSKSVNNSIATPDTDCGTLLHSSFIAPERCIQDCPKME